MIKNKRITIIIPAYNSEKTIGSTYAEIPKKFIDDIVLVDDGSTDNTSKISEMLGIHVLKHTKNKGYGAALKTGFSYALKTETDIIVVLHSDNQYPPWLLSDMTSPVIEEDYDVVIGSRFLGKDPLSEGMPVFRYYSNKILTAIQNAVLRCDLSEYHTGYRAYNAKTLDRIPYDICSNDFVFDNELLSQFRYFRYKITEISCPAVYTSETSSINLMESIIFGIKVLFTCLRYILHKNKIKSSRLYMKKQTGKVGL